MAQIFYGRAARQELKWCYTVYPTHASAHDGELFYENGKFIV